VTQQEQNEQHVDDTTTIPDSLPPNTEAAISSMEAANPTEVAASPNEEGRSCLLSLLELKLLPLRFEATTPHPSNNKCMSNSQSQVQLWLSRVEFWLLQVQLFLNCTKMVLPA